MVHTELEATSAGIITARRIPALYVVERGVRVESGAGRQRWLSRPGRLRTCQPNVVHRGPNPTRQRGTAVIAGAGLGVDYSQRGQAGMLSLRSVNATAGSAVVGPRAARIRHGEPTTPVLRLGPLVETQACRYSRRPASGGLVRLVLGYGATTKNVIDRAPAGSGIVLMECLALECAGWLSPGRGSRRVDATSCCI